MRNFFSVIVMMIVLGGFIGVYSYFFFRRILHIFKAPIQKRSIKLVLILVALIFTVLCINIFSFSAIIILHLVIIAMVIDIVNLIIKKIMNEKYNSIKVMEIWKMIHGLGIIPVIITAVLMIYGYYNMNHVVETDYRLYSDKTITAEADGTYRIALLADLHYGVSIDDEELLRVCNEISKQNPDMVVLCGDVVDENTTNEKMKTVFSTLATIENKYGIFYVYGNHDRQLYNSQDKRAYTESELADYIKSCGIKILQDEVYSVNDEFTIIGREDSSYNGGGNALLAAAGKRKELSELMEGVDKDDFILVLDHQPKEYKENEANGTDLLLSGHTHGGQIWPGNIIFNILKFDDAVYGETVGENGNFRAFVTSGVAGWGYPVKTAAPAEYVIIDIMTDNN